MKLKETNISDFTTSSASMNPAIFTSTASYAWIQLRLPSLYATLPEDKCPRAKNDVESQLPCGNTLENSSTYVNKPAILGM